MRYQWKQSDGTLCWYDPATWRVFVGGVFVCMAASVSEAKSLTRGF